jgi:ActR/RegA family two-component response regulator/AraC-like DNA-binding protein
MDESSQVGHSRRERVVSALPSRRVLWIDDEISDDQVEVRYLRELEFEVCCAQSPEAGLASAASESFDVILLDLNMPARSGLDVLEDLAFRNSRIPVLVLTGYGTMESAVAAMKLGAVDFLSKPIDVLTLPGLLWEVRARYPHGVDPPSLTEAEWVRLQCERLAECINRNDAIVTVVRLLLSERVTLRYFFGCVEALRLLLTHQEPSLALVKARATTAIRSGSTTPWPNDPRLLNALAALERCVAKQSQMMFANRSGLSRAYLSRRLIQTTGLRPSAWSRAAVMREGLRRLVSTRDFVAAIAHELGYEHSQFDREFVKTFGLTPTALRRRAQTPT